AFASAAANRAAFSAFCLSPFCFFDLALLFGLLSPIVATSGCRPGRAAGRFRPTALFRARGLFCRLLHLDLALLGLETVALVSSCHQHFLPKSPSRLATCAFMPRPSLFIHVS